MANEKRKISGTLEWADGGCNCVKGCTHNCKYCYARASFIKKGNEPEEWVNEKTDENRISFEWGKRDGIIMFPTNHDITEGNYEDAISVLKKLLSVGNDVLIVSKPKLSIISKLLNDLVEYKEQILLRFTIGSANNDVLSFWEPNATTFEERFACLKMAFEKTYSTSVSMEPFLDLDMDDVIKTAKSFLPFITNSVWIGKINGIDTRIADVREEIIDSYKEAMSDKNILYIYNELNYIDKIKWKESIKSVVGIDVPTEAGLDI